jgi:hypothetical protein
MKHSHLTLPQILMEWWLAFPFHYEMEANDNGWPPNFDRTILSIIDLSGFR